MQSCNGSRCRFYQSDSLRSRTSRPSVRLSWRSACALLKRNRAESVGFNFQWHVDKVVVIVNRVQQRDLDDGPLAEVLAEFLEGGVRYTLGARCFFHERQGGTLLVGKKRAGPV